ncbi:MAG: hypothetical protein ACT6QM_05900 [Brevundimonas mediterranea]|uniref:hypothetical protein n=1 Tax=Brevundimonas mediterranea TaxID=74329 RepID=UPI004034F023
MDNTKTNGSGFYPVTLTFTPEEREAFLARTDLVEGETIITPYMAFIDQFLGDWHSIALVDPAEWESDPEDDLPMPLAAPSGYVIELITEDQLRQFEWHSQIIRAQTNDLTAFKAKWPHIVTVREDARDRPDIPDDFPIGGDLTKFMFAGEIAFAKTGNGAFKTFASDLFEDEVVHFGFADKADAAKFKLFFGGA